MGDEPQDSSEGEAFSAPEIATLTPMLRHYLEVKGQHPDAILLYRMGDFFELFFEDAIRAAPILEVQLTARQKGSPSEAPMCGVPHHAVEAYIGKLLRAGLRVAICDQVEDPATAKGLVRREVVRVVTPGTVSELELLASGEPNWLAGLVVRGEVGALALLEVSTGEFLLRRHLRHDDLLEDLQRYQPRELVVVEGALLPELTAAIEARVGCVSKMPTVNAPRGGDAGMLLQRQFGVETLAGFGLEPGELAIEAAALALRYASSACHAELSHIREVRVERDDSCLIVDDATLRNLEIFKTNRDGTRKGSLFATLDRTLTAAGARMLRDWLLRPLRDRQMINRRLDALEDLLDDRRRDTVNSALRRVPDFERLVSRAVLGRLSVIEAGALRDGLILVPKVLEPLTEVTAIELEEIRSADRLADLAESLSSSLAPELPAQLKSGGVIAVGLNTELDRLRSLASGAQRQLLELEQRERARTGISTLKVRYNRVFGYYIEVSKHHRHSVPEIYERKQTLANAERYSTEELKRLEVEILEAQERQKDLEQELFSQLVQSIADQATRLQALARGLAKLDVFSCLAANARRWSYSRPVLLGGGEPMIVREGRHPVVERALRGSFVANDCELDTDSRQVVLVTGPNMGGKSTFLRQVALICLMAQAGSFVPAKSAALPVLDRIFTRVGASDDLARGESTFMVEMVETANILRFATRESLVILDEVGRGTSTYDGLSLAWAIVEHLHNVVGSRTLFATHYHELTSLSEALPRVRNSTLLVKEWQDRIVFLHRVAAGSADKSYGIQVAKLAGLPDSVTERARRVLNDLQRNDLAAPRVRGAAKGVDGDESSPREQLSLFARVEDVVAGLLRDLDLDRMTPVAALNLLQTLKDRLAVGQTEAGIVLPQEPPDDDAPTDPQTSREAVQH